MTRAPTTRRRGGQGKRKRPHPAARSRIGATGLGAASMFGLVAAMSFAQQPGSAPSVEPSLAPMVLQAATAPAAPTTLPATNSATGITPGTSPPTTSGPIVLTARPAITQPAKPTTAPTTKTHGSR